jgi:hypothetical protein
LGFAPLAACTEPVEVLRKSGKGKNDLFIFGQAKKEDKNPASNRTILNHQYSKLNE